MKQRIEIADADTMQTLGSGISPQLNQGMIIFLHGELGAGKTTLVNGILQGLGHRGLVTSPTFTLVESYQLELCQVFHFDLYRIEDPMELEAIGVRDMLGGNSLCLFEWPEHGSGVLPVPSVEITIQYDLPGRVVLLDGLTDRVIIANRSYRKALG